MATDGDMAEPSSYRLFFLDDQGRIKKSRALASSDDEAAITEARGLGDGRTLELYDGCRLVLRILREDQVGESPEDSDSLA